MGDIPNKVLDERDDDTKRLTSHLNSLTLQQNVEAAQEEEVKADTTKLPKDVKSVLELLKEAQDFKPATRSEQVAKTARINRVSAHLHAIQQGPVAPEITSNNSRALTSAQTDHAKNAMVEQMRQRNTILDDYITALEEASSSKAKELKAENTALKAENKSLTDEITALKTPKT